MGELTLCEIKVEVAQVPEPVFETFDLCEPRTQAETPGRDFSWVPFMRPGRTLNTFPNFPQTHNVSRPRFVNIHTLRAQHFVKAFEAGGEHGKRYYDWDFDRKVEDQFTEEDRGMSWAIPLLRPEAVPAGAVK